MGVCSLHLSLTLGLQERWGVMGPITHLQVSFQMDPFLTHSQEPGTRNLWDCPSYY